MKFQVGDIFFYDNTNQDSFKIKSSIIGRILHIRDGNWYQYETLHGYIENDRDFANGSAFCAHAKKVDEDTAHLLRLLL